MIPKIENIRDLLIVSVAPTLPKTRGAYAATDLNYDEATVAAVLDSLTVLSLEKLIEYRNEHGWPEGFKQ